MKKNFLTARIVALILIACMLPVCALAEESNTAPDEVYVSFFLMCNEGMKNDSGDVDNTMMAVSMNIFTGDVRLLVFTWDTFVEYEGYDVPQRIDVPFRKNGAEETMKVFDRNFDFDIDQFLSLNYSNLADLIDSFGGVDVDVTRAEKNALNGLIKSKLKSVRAAVEAGVKNDMLDKLLSNDNYLNDYGPKTHLNGLQAVAFGWLQYDSVYDCCLRQIDVISNLFTSVAKSVGEKVVLYTQETGIPEDLKQRRAIDVENLTKDDLDYMREFIAPIFDLSYNNLEEEDIYFITTALIMNAYEAQKQGEKLFEAIECEIFPLEAKKEYDLVAGTYGHLVDYKANREAMKSYLYGER